MAHNKVTNELKLIRGTIRRTYLTLFRQGYVRASLARRQGECRRCGTCCALSWRCRCSYLDQDRLPACTIYNTLRLKNCSQFPLDARDLADRDLVAPDIPCGYRWPDESRPG